MNKDKRYRKVGWISSILIQVVLLILFYFVVAWKEPFPPIPSYGIELNFGTASTGSGIRPSQTRSEESPSEEVPDETTESASSASSESETEEEVPANTGDEPIKTNTSESSQSSEVPETREEKVSSANETVTDSSDETISGEGKTEGVTNEGKEEAKLEDQALMGAKGATSKGSNLQLAGWVWDFKPNPDDRSSETGKIVYQIKVDQEGYLISIDLVSSTVAPAVERIYRQSIEQLTFSKTSEYSPAPVSSGTITFVIQSK